MSPEAQCIAIAEACGWTKVGDWVGLRGLRGHKPNLPFGCLSKVPGYLTDLNAMHEAEKVLKGAIQHQYADWLQRCAPADGRTAFKTLRATAAQRAEAFLRTIGKWEGQP